jgi:hypothetical protein
LPLRPPRRYVPWIIGAQVAVVGHSEETLRREGAQPTWSADDFACDGIFDTDEELDEFLQFTYAARRADIA